MDGASEAIRGHRLAVEHLARRDLSRRRLSERLRRSGLGEATIDGVVEAMVEAGYVDDLRLARSRARQLADRGYGDALIEDRLAREGIEPAAIREVVAGLEPERDRIRALIEDGRDPLRAAARLTRRGFSTEAVEEACEPAAAHAVDGVDRTRLR